jgi:hypothetical protein
VKQNVTGINVGSYLYYSNCKVKEIYQCADWNLCFHLGGIFFLFFYSKVYLLGTNEINNEKITSIIF